MEMMQKEMKDLRSQLVQVKKENAKLKQDLEAGGQGSGYPGKFQKTQGIGGGGQYNSRVGYASRGGRENRAVPYKRGQGWGNGPYPPQTQQFRQHQPEEDERKETGYYCRVGGRDEVMEDLRYERASFGRARIPMEDLSPDSFDTTPNGIRNEEVLTKLTMGTGGDEDVPEAGRQRLVCRSPRSRWVSAVFDWYQGEDGV
jgi:hypothetical protein